MANLAFDELVRREHDAVRLEPPVDWNKERDQWLASLELLYGQVESFLAEYVAANQVVIERGTLQLNEENIGSYLAPTLKLKIGRKVVSFEPVGTVMVAVKGRVDLVSSIGRATLVLVDKHVTSVQSLMFGSAIKVQPHWVWKIMTRPPDRKIVEITKETLLDLLTEVADG